MSTEPFHLNLPSIKLPREALAAIIRPWLEALETKRNEAGGPDLSNPELLSLNAKGLADYIGNRLDSMYTELCGEMVKKASMYAYSVGLGKPLPTFTIGQEAPPAKPHPSRAVQTVERDPETLEVVRTVTNYE